MGLPLISTRFHRLRWVYIQSFIRALIHIFVPICALHLLSPLLLLSPLQSLRACHYGRCVLGTRGLRGAARSTVVHIATNIGQGQIDHTSHCKLQGTGANTC